jgi:hypothetical protein
VRFVVVGYLDRQSTAWQSDDARLTVHGSYDPIDLRTLLDHYCASLVLYPSAGPESFAFTLSEVWSAGRPVLVPPIGALAERVDAHGAGWILDDDEWRDESRMLDRIVSLLAPGARPALDAAARRAIDMPLPSIVDMVETTLAIYERTAAARPVDHVEVDRLRVVEAFGYRRWVSPSAPASPAAMPATPPPAPAARVRGLLARMIGPRQRRVLKAGPR